MREASGKINFAAKGHTGILTIPADIMVDSAFPFKVPSRVRIIIGKITWSLSALLNNKFDGLLLCLRACFF